MNTIIVVLFIIANSSIAYAQESQNPVVYSKRAAILLDRILVALQRALEDDVNMEESSEAKRYPYGAYTSEIVARNIQRPQMKVAPKNEMDIPRISRGIGVEQRDQSATTARGGNIWRCYFNAVTCF